MKIVTFYKNFNKGEDTFYFFIALLALSNIYFVACCNSTVLSPYHVLLMSWSLYNVPNLE